MRPENEAKAIASALDRIGEMLTWPSERLYVVAESVSSWSPAQQLEHVLLSLERFADAIATLEEGSAEHLRPKGSPRLAARAVLLTGRVPRGRAKAPEAVRPDAVPGRAGLRERNAASRAWLADLAPRVGDLRAVRRTIPHPVLGCFNAVQWLRFARIHTDHHLAIIDDIDRTGLRAVTEPDPMAPLGDVP